MFMFIYGWARTMQIKNSIKIFVGYAKYVALSAGVISVLGMIAGNLYLFHRVGDLSDGYTSVKSSLHAAEKECALATNNVKNIDQNYRNLKDFEVLHVNSH